MDDYKFKAGDVLEHKASGSKILVHSLYLQKNNVQQYTVSSGLEMHDIPYFQIELAYKKVKT